MEAMSDHEDQRLAGVLAAFACGLAAGAALGLLLAPARGRDSRQWIAARGRAAARGAAQVLDRQRVYAIIRERGIRGLADALQRRARPGEPAPGTPDDVLI